MDYLSKGEAVSDIWRVTGEGTYVEETQAVGDGGELHAQKVTRKCAVDIAMRWTNGYDTTMRSFVNVVETPGGGTHVDGYLLGMTKQIRKAIEDNARKLKVNLKDSNMKVERDDILSGLVAVITVRIAEPQFQGQTKDVLGTAQVKPIVSKMTDKQFGEMITGSKRGYKEQSGRVLEKIVGEMHARIQARKTKEVTRRKNALESASMPPKLSDCQPGNDDVAELFIVEGDSAGGSAIQGRNPITQAILPLRGKILNTERASLDRMMKSETIESLITAVGGGYGEDFDLNKVRYHKVIIMADADVDGAHIATLNLTLFFRYMRPMITAGYVYVAMPPLYRLKWTKGAHDFVYTDAERDRVLAEGKAAGRQLPKGEGIQRYKGLGEMSYQELWETTMDPDHRILKQVQIEDAAAADETFSMLMGDEVEPRRLFIQRNARNVSWIDA